ncbi:MAG: acetamidase [Clostridia bacterium]|nr:acetamidase [Clostridia bacterium]
MITEYVYDFSKKNEPAAKVKPGEEVKFKTLDCFSDQIKREEQLVTSLDFDKVNPATGPVYIEGAEPGDTIAVEILSIKIEDQGVVSTLPDTGSLIANAETRTKIVPIREGKAIFNDLEFPVKPMIGVIGVAPREGSIACGYVGFHGGNMDNNRIMEGSKVFFPVNVPGALLQLGDLHATMGDGEICGTGIEIAGEVTVRFHLIQDFPIERPVLETHDDWYTIASAREYTEALRLVTEDMQNLIVDAYGWDATDAYLYMSIQGNVEICQGCRPSSWDIILRFSVPKIEGKPLII